MIPDKTELLKDSYNFFQLETLIESDEVCLLSLLNELSQNFLHIMAIRKIKLGLKNESLILEHYLQSKSFDHSVFQGLIGFERKTKLYEKCLELFLLEISKKNEFILKESVFATDRNGRNVFFYLVNNNYLLPLKTLGEIFPDFIQCTNKTGETLLMRAILMKNIEMVEFLIKSGVKINAKNKVGRSAIDYLSQINEERIKKRIIDIKISSDRKTYAIFMLSRGRFPYNANYIKNIISYL